MEIVRLLAELPPERGVNLDAGLRFNAGRIDCVRVILDVSRDLDLFDALVCAYECNYLEIVRLLLHRVTDNAAAEHLRERFRGSKMYPMIILETNCNKRHKQTKRYKTCSGHCCRTPCISRNARVTCESG